MLDCIASTDHYLDEFQERVSLSRLLNNRRWKKRKKPFPHILGENVFTDDFYRELELSFQHVISQSKSNGNEPGSLSRNIQGYDAFALNFSPRTSGCFRVFLSRPWHDMLSSLLGIKTTGDINGGLHHHEIGSAHGWIHNDLNPGWFLDYKDQHGINISDPALYSYTNGTSIQPGMMTQPRVRAIAIIYYINNPPWAPGDGGETGLYLNKDAQVANADLFIPPINNSILVFECTPYSYHAFITNRKHPRNSIIMWLHRSKEEALALWGEAQIVHWSSGQLI